MLTSLAKSGALALMPGVVARGGSIPTDLNRYVFDSTGMAPSNTVDTVAAGREYTISRRKFAVSKSGLHSWFWPAWYHAQTGGASTAASDHFIQGAIIESARGTTVATIQWSGSGSTTITSNTGKWSDDVSLAAGEYWVVTAQQSPIGATRVGMWEVCPANGDAMQASASDLSAFLTNSAAITGTSFASGVTNMYGPIMGVVKGWDGQPVGLFQGNSIAEGSKSTTDRYCDSRGNKGYLATGLDSLTGGRLTYGNIAVPGMTLTSGMPAVRAPMVAALTDSKFGSGVNYKPPWTFQLCEMGVNQFDTSTGATKYPTFLTAYAAFQTAWKAISPGQKWGQCTLTPRDTNLNNQYYTSAASGDQGPVGTDGTSPNGRWAFNDALRAGTISGVDFVVDVEPYFSDPTLRDRWSVPPRAGALTAIASNGASSITTNFAMRVGDSFVVNPGSATNYRSTVDSVTDNGNGTWTHTTANTVASGPWAVTTVVKTRNSADGVHPLRAANDDAMPAVTSVKGQMI